MRSMIITIMIGLLVISFTFPVFAERARARATSTGSILGRS
ncbi:hypothetical protein [Methanooceanicella nereidis]|nr:hypothetical protein [Methanocella sp. CWC-04]